MNVPPVGSTVWQVWLRTFAGDEVSPQRADDLEGEPPTVVRPRGRAGRFPSRKRRPKKFEQKKL